MEQKAKTRVTILAGADVQEKVELPLLCVSRDELVCNPRDTAECPVLIMKKQIL